MVFEKQPDYPLVVCPACRGSGLIGERRCRTCHGAAIGWRNRSYWLYLDFPLSRYRLSLHRSRRIFNAIRRYTFVIAGANAWLWLIFRLRQAGLLHALISPAASPREWLGALTPNIKLLFWCGLLFLSYAFYRFVRERSHAEAVEIHRYKLADGALPADTTTQPTWAESRKVPKHLTRNIIHSFSLEAKQAVENSYAIAEKELHAVVDPAHLFYAVLESPHGGAIFLRLGIAARDLKEKIKQSFSESALPKQTARDGAVILPDFYQTLFRAYEIAYTAHKEDVGLMELLVAAAEKSAIIQQVLYDFSVDKDKLANVIEWARIRERLRYQAMRVTRGARHHSKHGLDRAMTAVATPYLDQLSEDLTQLAMSGRLAPSVAREAELEEIFRIVEGERRNVLLVGDHGIGKHAIIAAIAERVIADDVPRPLFDKRLVNLSISSLLSGTTPSGAVERLEHIMAEIRRAHNIVLIIHNIHELIDVSAGASGKSLDVSDSLAELLANEGCFTIATTTPEGYAQSILRSNLGNLFTQVEIKEINQNQAVQVLESRVGYEEYKNQVFFSYDALEQAVRLTARFIHESYLPGSALEVMSEAAVFTRNKKGKNTVVTAEEVAAIVAQKTKIPVTAVTLDESAKLIHLEEELHRRVIGQDEAVVAVASALRRARAELRSSNRPIANFLFLGPTGVGKTELVKTIAESYFGGEEQMVRLDMSEYQDKSSIYRLIGAPGESGTGILTEAIRKHPFSLLLLDELEKADKDVLNLFLQVMDDGRLSDSTGRAIDFTNVILIATSNAGTAYVGEELKKGTPEAVIKERLLHGELKSYFRPEFLNRFDGIILFKPLRLEDIKKITALLLQGVAKNLAGKGIEFRTDEEGINFIANAGFDPEFGARPLRRAVQEQVENKLADLLLAQKLKRRDVVVLGANGKITVV